ncbi:hypothetical protein RRG08_011974 [Elysia crispata]|uniref:Uncharacterized protein n=1 Tax=Elysia crispata TaxID=231223 RepID=A0AAE0ZJ11_9GAST|nr:hypothetical protein RRG08_011974 [Elysia crispata]
MTTISPPRTIPSRLLHQPSRPILTAAAATTIAGTVKTLYLHLTNKEELTASLVRNSSEIHAWRENPRD